MKNLPWISSENQKFRTPSKNSFRKLTSEFLLGIPAEVPLEILPEFHPTILLGNDSGIPYKKNHDFLRKLLQGFFQKVFLGFLHKLYHLKLKKKWFSVFFFRGFSRNFLRVSFRDFFRIVSNLSPWIATTQRSL